MQAPSVIPLPLICQSWFFVLEMPCILHGHLQNSSIPVSHENSGTRQEAHTHHHRLLTASTGPDQTSGSTNDIQHRVNKTRDTEDKLGDEKLYMKKKKKTQLLSFTRKKTWKLRLKWSTTWKHCLTYDSHKPTSKGHLWDNWEHSNTEYCMLLEHNRCDNGTVLTLLKSLLQMNTKVYIIGIRSCVGLAFKHSRSKKQKQTNKKKQWGPISGETLAKSLKTVEAGW